MREQFMHASNNNMLINLANKERRRTQLALLRLGGVAEGDGLALLSVEDPACFSWRGQAAVTKESFRCCFSACLALRCNRLFAIFQTFFFFLLKLSAVCTFWIVLMC